MTLTAGQRGATHTPQSEEEESLILNDLNDKPTDLSGKRMEPGIIYVNRPSYSKVKFDETFGYHEEVTKSCKEKITEFARSKCSVANLLSFFPFINVVKTYKWKSWIIKDLLAGLTVGVIHVPQSLGFALLTEVAPVYGLYSSFFPVVIYFFLGTSRHVSVGTMAVISLMIGSVVQKQASQSDLCNGGSNVTSACGDFKVGIAMSVSLIAGAVQLIMSFLQLGVISLLMSQPFVGGFTAGAVFHIATSQVKSMLGLVNLKSPPGMFRLPKTYINIFSIITQTSITELVITIITMTVLVGIKEGVNEKFKNKLKVPIPIELLVVITAILITHFALIPNGFDVKIVGEIPPGFPAPRVPPMHNATSYIVDGFLVGIISFVISISLAKIFQNKYNYQIDENQELFAHGVFHFVGCFFSSFAGAVAPPRCFAHESAGGKSQVASLFAALLILLVILVMGPLFASLPKSVLACIIVAALVPVFKSFTILKPLWKLNKIDFLVWLLTWAATAFLNVDIGLGIGIGLSMILPSLNNLILARGRVLNRAINSELYAFKETYDHLQELKGISIFRFEYPLFYMTAERFKKQLYAQTVKPDPPKKEKKNKDSEKNDASLNNGLKDSEKKDASLSKGPENSEKKDVSHTNSSKESEKKDAFLYNDPQPVLDAKGDVEMTVKHKSKVQVDLPTEKSSKPECKTIVLDLSAVPYIDVVGVNTLKIIKREYTANEIKVAIVCTVEDVVNKLQRGNVEIPLFPSIEDAVKENQTEYIHLEKVVVDQSDL